MNAHLDLRHVGRSIERTDAAEKVSGKSVYTVDVALPGMLHAKVLRSPHAHARILSVDASAARAMPGVRAVLTAADLPAEIMPFYGYFIKDQPIVAIDKVRYEGDIVAAIAADDEGCANRALAAIKVSYEILPHAATIEAALSADAPELFETPPLGIVPLYGEGARGALRPQRNVCYEFGYETGSPSAFDACDHVFEDEFRFSRMHHFHLEPFVCVAQWKNDSIEVTSSCQNPFPLRKELARMFKVPENRIKVRVPFVGGGYGAKNNCKTEPVAVLLSRMTGKPVRFCMTLEEGFLTNTQHAAILRVKTGVMRDGRLVARESTIWLDAGAYSDGSPLVAEKAGYRIPGPYRYDYIKTDCLCVMTSTAPAGPFRGFGAMQTSWASESQIDMIAHRLGIHPYRIREINLLDLGQPFVPGESGIDSDLREGLDVVAKAIGFGKKDRVPNRGIGFAIGFKDGGGVNKPASARVKVSTSGDVYIQCGTVEIGQGHQSAMIQIVAEVMKTSLAKVRYMAVDTDYVPFDQGTNASSGMSVMGQAVERAVRGLRARILEFAAEFLHCPVEDLDLEDWHIRKGNERLPLVPMIMGRFGGTGYEFTADGFFKAENSHHAPLEAPCVFWEISWGAAEVEVDPETGKVDVLELVVSGDAGRAINPLVCRGQDEGAAMMGLGQALFERMIYEDGKLLNGDALFYRVPLAEDLPASFVSITQEQGHGPGPFGSKGMGEGGMLPVPPAIANAIQDAIGIRITSLPITPDKVLAAIELKNAQA